ncbi:hypothetical protein E8E13_007341 [Curvularia kusanoi]|uniref:F-box domain-containing protein n=1 Tax=Curvularia kusanoi TaxID=90978 RepID=A0A9P4W7T3_CURKU|nr:hypothetical protein E8E13_007341 [Curvularia kusanoi]
MASFGALSNELKLIIIEAIESTWTASRLDDTSRWTTEHHFPIANTDLLRLSKVNHNLRNLVAPYIFRNIILRNTTRNGTSVALIASSRYAKYVKRVLFVGTNIQPRFHPDASDPLKFHGIHLPEIVEQTLSELDHFPSLEGVDIWFRLQSHADFGSEEWADDYYDFFLKDMTRPVLLDHVYLALTRNRPGTVRDLVLQNLVPVPSPTFERAEWHSFLGGLSSFGLQLYASDGGWYPVFDHWDSRPESLLEAGIHFWRYLCNITHLSVSVGPQAVLGCNKDFTEPMLLNLGSAMLPNLKSVSFDFVFVGSIMLEFLLKHAATLCSVHMDHSFVTQSDAPGVMPGSQMTWSKVFTALTDAPTPFSNLTKFEVLCTGDWETAEEYEIEQRARIEKDEQILGAGTPELRYCLIDYASGEVTTAFDPDEELADESTGQDHTDLAQPRPQRNADKLAYNRFMDTVKGNRERLGIA